MPIFISYSQKDRDFVDKLAINLVTAKHHVWMDRWELGVGDSLTNKIQTVLTDSSAILVILSKNSVDSEWCKRELTAGLVRELEEKKTIVMPCVIDDCVIPLFLRDKLYADFRADPDQAFKLIDTSLSKISNAAQGRVESPDFFTDWAVDWNDAGSDHLFRWSFVDHGPNLPYVVLTQLYVKCNQQANLEYLQAVSNNCRMEYINKVLLLVATTAVQKKSMVLISDNLERHVLMNVIGTNKTEFKVLIAFRRMGLGQIAAPGRAGR